MTIQWFPGHMASARKKAAETLARADVVVEVLDARLPAASCNPMIDELRTFRQRPSLKVLNKADLADAAATQAWVAHFCQQPGVTAVALSCRKPGDVQRIPAICKTLAPHRNSTIKPLRLMIMGIPNVGKSTLMNALLKKRLAAVGDEPAVTKQQQRIDLSPELTLIDTPGLMWPKIEFDSDGFMLAASHAIGRNAVIDEEVAAFLGDLLLKRYGDSLIQRYRLKPEALHELDGVSLLEAIGKKRGCLMRGGEIDMEKAALVLLNDYRSGSLGRITLETPASREGMLQSHLAQQAGEATPEE